MSFKFNNQAKAKTNPLASNLDMELDDLLKESVEQYEKKKKAGKILKSGQELPSARYMDEDCWQTVFVAPLFIRYTCSKCGAVSMIFSHYVAYMEFKSRKINKEKKFVRIDHLTLEQELSLDTPRCLDRTVPICSDCFPVNECIGFTDSRYCIKQKETAK